MTSSGVPSPIVPPGELGLLTLQDPLSPLPKVQRAPLTGDLWVRVVTVLVLQGMRCTMTVAVVLRWGMEGPASATRINSS